MSLTSKELQQFNEEGYVVKPAVFSTGDLQPIQDALSEIVDTEAKRLQSEGVLEDIFPDEPFGNRLGHISKSNLDAAVEITKGVMARAVVVLVENQCLVCSPTLPYCLVSKALSGPPLSVLLRTGSAPNCQSGNVVKCRGTKIQGISSPTVINTCLLPAGFL